MMCSPDIYKFVLSSCSEGYQYSVASRSSVSFIQPLETESPSRSLIVSQIFGKVIENIKIIFSVKIIQCLKKNIENIKYLHLFTPENNK